ncbi:unnamed protein product [Urochloa decumbens]|uniref:F-box domain-containing protein n=1 Tax=Urochloa decumbens TaxID=240449 RepID=A0ABC8ZBG4_9POAL
MESHSRRRCRRRSNVAGSAMEEEEDRLSSLPDDLLHSILRSLPLKNAARTSALSRRWAPQWLRALASSPAIDLTDRDFARGHGAGAFGLDVVGWVAAAVARGARDVEVDLAPPQKDEDADLGAAALMELPSDVFRARSSLERLSLGGFSLAAVALPAAGLAGLRSLSLTNTNVTDEAVQAVLAGCPAIESLALTRCPLLSSVSVASETLRVLQLLGCPAVRELRVVAPALESFAFLGPVYFRVTEDYEIPVELGVTETTAIPALRDACMCHLGFGEYENPSAQDYEYPFLYYVAHTRVLTLCYIGLLLIYEQSTYDETAYTDLPNLEELQLLMSSMDNEGNEGLEHVSKFFMFSQLPVLERLFVHLPSDGGSCSEAVLTDESDDDDDDIVLVLDYEVVLDRLTLIKVVNFRGARRELRLLRFFLKRAPVLEQLVLATKGHSRAGVGDAQGVARRAHLRLPAQRR